MDIDCEVCVVGGGPAGMMLGLLLAQEGIDVVVLEKHSDFLRDFRGDTVHPSTLDVLDELGLEDATARLPHRDVSRMQVSFSDETYTIADFNQLRVPHPYVRFMPQWEFLTVLAEAAESLPTFRLLRRHEVTDLRRRDGSVTGVVATGPQGPVHVSAGLTVAADGRSSVVRAKSGLVGRDFHAPMDVLWFRVSRSPEDVTGLDMHIGAGAVGLAIDRGDYWQVAHLVEKGTAGALRAGSIEKFRDQVATLIPSLAPKVSEIRGWDDVKTLTVQLNRLKTWHAPGLLCIGDAAHAMSPVGGVGINLAIQDAVAAARILTRHRRTGQSKTLAAIQRRRHLPTVLTQLGQRLAHRFLVAKVLRSTEPIPAPATVRLMARFPVLQRIPARIVGIGVLPEHIRRGQPRVQ